MALKADDDHLRPVPSDQQPTHVATGRKLLDAKPLSADSRAHPAACMAPRMMEKAETRREGNGVQPAGADVEQRQDEQRQPPPARRNRRRSRRTAYAVGGATRLASDSGAALPTRYTRSAPGARTGSGLTPGGYAMRHHSPFGCVALMAVALALAGSPEHVLA